MQPIAEWLQEFGLEQYVARFIENGIDLSVLPDLTDQDLESLGVILGHRRRILRAARNLPTAAPTVQAAPQTNAAMDQGERRNLTVMFCDLVGSTARSERLDPEDMRAIIRAYQDCCAGAVARYDGFVAQFLGDGVLVYFGYPQAHEDDAERAVRAGLDIISAVAHVPSPDNSGLQVHIGIATGLVVVGDLIGQQGARERAVVGATPNLAARLQELAAPGEIIVAASTRRLLGDLFPMRDRGTMTLKGLENPIQTWVVQGTSSTKGRFGSAHTGRLTSFVGRESDVALLEERRQLAWQGHGQIVMVSGEAGIGKSRFITEFSDRIDDGNHTKLRNQCSPYHTASTLYPIIEQLHRAAGLGADDPADTKLDKIEAMLRQTTPNLLDTAPLLAALLSIPAESRYKPLGYSAARQRRQTLAALLDQLEALSRRQPIVMLFEDIHWADASTLELLNLTIERVRTLPILALITHRPEFESPWLGLGNVTSISLDRLNRRHVRRMISWLTAGKPLPEEVTTQIFAKTDGIPLFVEELTKAVLESRMLIEERDAYRIDGALPPLAIPPTLQDSLMARLDRLAPVREIAQVAAAIGREFSYNLLEAVVDSDPNALNDSLDRLVDSELLYRGGIFSNALYRFKHALVRDAAYESMLRSRRQVLHRRIAEAMRDRFPVMAVSEPEVIAHHFDQGGMLEQALHWWTTAADQAFRQSAYVEAIAHYYDAIRVANSMPADGEHRRRLIRLHIALGDALHTGRSPGAKETREAYARARALTSALSHGSERYPIYHGLWTGSVVRADIASMRDLSTIFQDAVDVAPDSPEAGLGHRFVGVLQWMSGDPVPARSHLEASVAAYERDPHYVFDFQIDLHPGVMAMLQLAIVSWLLGDTTRAHEISQKGLSLALASGHTPTIVYSYTWNGTLDILRDEPAAAMASASEILRLGQEHGLPFWQAIGTFFLDWSRWRNGDPTVGPAGMRQSIEVLADQGLVWYTMLLRMLFAVPESEMTGSEAGLAMVATALQDIEATGMLWPLAEALRYRGDILITQSLLNAAEAERCYQRAIAVAKSQGAASLEVRAALGLAKLYRGTGREALAADVLSTALTSFDDTADMPEVSLARQIHERPPVAS